MRVYDENEVGELNAEPWQIELLQLNPEYVYWGVREDYMAREDDSFESRVIHPTWRDFGPWELDDYNECVNFYFEVVRASCECPLCAGNGYAPEAQDVVNTFYRHMNPRGEHWCDAITQDELDALIDAGRLPAGSNLAEVNAANAYGARGMGHDAINRHILVGARLRRLGLPDTCPECGGRGTVYTAPRAHVALTLWILHPRKGCSRGVEVSGITEQDLPAIKAWLREAAARNAQRFAAVLS